MFFLQFSLLFFLLSFLFSPSLLHQIQFFFSKCRTFVFGFSCWFFDSLQPDVVVVVVVVVLHTSFVFSSYSPIELSHPFFCFSSFPSVSSFSLSFSSFNFPFFLPLQFASDFRSNGSDLRSSSFCPLRWRWFVHF